MAACDLHSGQLSFLQLACMQVATSGGAKAGKKKKKGGAAAGQDEDIDALLAELGEGVSAMHGRICSMTGATGQEITHLPLLSASACMLAAAGQLHCSCPCEIAEYAPGCVCSGWLSFCSKTVILCSLERKCCDMCTCAGSAPTAESAAPEPSPEAADAAADAAEAEGDNAVGEDGKV